MADGFGRGLHTSDGWRREIISNGSVPDGARADCGQARPKFRQPLQFTAAELSDLPSRSKLSGRLFRYSAGDHHPPLTTDDDVHYGESESSIRNAIAAGETSSEVRISFCVSHFVSLFFLPAICLGLCSQVLLRRNLGAFTLERRRLKGAKCW